MVVSSLLDTSWQHVWLSGTSAFSTPLSCPSLCSTPELPHFGCTHEMIFPTWIFRWSFVITSCFSSFFMVVHVLLAKWPYWRDLHRGSGPALHLAHLLTGWMLSTLILFPMRFLHLYLETYSSSVLSRHTLSPPFNTHTQIIYIYIYIYLGKKLLFLLGP